MTDILPIVFISMHININININNIFQNFWLFLEVFSLEMIWLAIAVPSLDFSYS